MNASVAFRLFLAALILPIIAWKAAVAPDNSDYLESKLSSFLERNRFDVVVTDTLINEAPVLRASTAVCQLQLASLTHDGSNRDLIRHFTAGADRSFVVFRGQVYTDQPVTWTVLDHLWTRALRELGLTRYVEPLIAVAADSACNAERLPWAEFRSG